MKAFVTHQCGYTAKSVDNRDYSSSVVVIARDADEAVETAKQYLKLKFADRDPRTGWNKRNDILLSVYYHYVNSTWAIPDYSKLDHLLSEV